MEFSLTEEQKSLRDAVIRFARQEIKHDLSLCDKEGRFPIESWKKCAEMQIMALPFAEEYGGCGSDFLTTVVVLQALAYGCKDAGLVHAVITQILCGIQINLFGSLEQKNQYLPMLCQGEKIFAQAITEPEAGSDALGAMRTLALKVDDGYVLNGTKVFISNGPIADVVIVFALTDPAARRLDGVSTFLIEKDNPGFEQCRPIEKMGLCTLQNGELVFRDCRVSPTALIGREGQGAIIFNESMEWERSLMPAAHLGTLERVLETCVGYARKRSAFGQPIGKFQAVANKIVDMKTVFELGRLILYKAASIKSQGRRAGMEASIAKLFISEGLKQSCLDAVQVHGGYGFTREYELERDLRDSVAATIYSGTSELQRSIISRLMGL
ncbi:acyl-CoA dehydrogenase family protein [Desulfuromonas sp. CSMB_57]|uniref:acyl-CoA dehydrogenase family protein n=1 Tax=Desulfuromonas sp. CSMB_57 TaxID=2807629 RepID=UPI001CD227F3|nr:acyl-CoA dehydrogenase family protein [Desulfuromonas sp. CSMB_57]